MAERKAQAEWRDGLQEGEGVMRTESGALEASFTFPTRFEDGQGSNPEELIGAAHAGCYSMALSAGLGDAGYTPRKIVTDAAVSIEKGGGGFNITYSALKVKATVPGISEDEFMKIAQDTKKNCPVSKALGGLDIRLEAELTSDI
jgi:lipoyl-dependent peroxiredoxin